ncbi:hypothetical protein [Companilactobacillus farciminis]|uniref:hypothetical protein n=1 Tax=Companilactobacillus farciminis TaxID=1612 RepID=UPI00232C58E4|nr:hypothetical protein [Companilactobacillus farciminis]WCG35665.1 hypothetical protein PML84_00345 [Companilactobacillus farciminis]
MKLEFGRKVSYKPLLVIVAVSLIIGAFIYTFSDSIMIAGAFAILCLVIGPFLYSINLNNNYGYWEVTDKGIYFYDYSTLDRKLSAIIVPAKTNQEFLEFSKIAKISLVSGEGIKVPDNIVGGVFFNVYAPERLLVNLATPFYLELKTTDGFEIILDLSMDATEDEKIEQALKQITSKSGQDVELLQQTV